MSEMGQRFKAIRLRKGLNQEQFADFLGVRNRQNISRYETGKLSIPDDIKVLLHDKGFSVTWLITGEGPMLKRDCEQATTEGDLQKKNIERLEALESECEDLRATISKLRSKNNELSAELIERLRDLCHMKDKLLSLKQ
jgi:transcriptional regulator with XRE-family HTH domain